jgi:hypothetical protein
MPLIVISAAFGRFGDGVVTSPDHIFRVPDTGFGEMALHGPFDVGIVRSAGSMTERGVQNDDELFDVPKRY